MERRPKASEKADHQRGKIAMLSMYNATDRLVIVGEVLRSWATCPSEAARMQSVEKPGQGVSDPTYERRCCCPLVQPQQQKPR